MSCIISKGFHTALVCCGHTGLPGGERSDPQERNPGSAGHRAKRCWPRKEQQGSRGPLTRNKFCSVGHGGSCSIGTINHHVNHQGL